MRGGPRKFDHDEARRLRAEDPKRWTYRALARRFGVSDSAVERVVNPRTRARMDAASAKWLRDRREPCRGGCGHLVWRHGASRSGYCRACLGALQATGVYDDGLACHRCGEKKPDDAFPRGGSVKARRGRHTLCSVCQTEARREYRHARRVPCSHGCGRMVDSTGRRDPDKPYECRPCVLKRIRPERKAAA